MVTTQRDIVEESVEVNLKRYKISDSQYEEAGRRYREGSTGTSAAETEARLPFRVNTPSYISTRVHKRDASFPGSHNDDHLLLAMTDNVQLTTRICERLNESKEGEENEEVTNSRPTVQILSIKKVGQTQGQNSLDRYRVIVSDGEFFLQAMLATQINSLIENGQLVKNSIVIIDKCTCNPVGDGGKKCVFDAS